jgi:shikimate dehydrogenase
MPQVYTLETLSSLQGSLPLYGVIGYPVAHSLSPAMQMAAFTSSGSPAQYVRVECPPGGLGPCVAQMKKLGFRGWNCTIPHKLEMADWVDTLHSSAQSLGGVNTVSHTDNRLTGYNTDGQGWVNAVREEFHLEIKDLRIMILGIGGAGRAIATQAALGKCQRLVLVNRSPEKASELAASLATLRQADQHSGSELIALPWEEDCIREELQQIDLLVNASSVGLKEDDPSVLSEKCLHPGLHIYDTIYRPTSLLAQARKIGAPCANGLSMLLHQGALAYEIWTGRKPDLEAMRSTLPA